MATHHLETARAGGKHPNVQAQEHIDLLKNALLLIFALDCEKEQAAAATGLLPLVPNLFSREASFVRLAPAVAARVKVVVASFTQPSAV